MATIPWRSIFLKLNKEDLAQGHGSTEENFTTNHHEQINSTLALYAILTPIGETSMPKITNEEEALATVMQYGETLRFVPVNLKTAEIYLEAVKQDGEAFECVPEALRAEVHAALKDTARIGLK